MITVNMKKTPNEVKELLEEIKQKHKNIAKSQLSLLQKYMNKAYELGADSGYLDGARDFLGH